MVDLHQEHAPRIKVICLQAVIRDRIPVIRAKALLQVNGYQGQNPRYQGQGAPAGQGYQGQNPRYQGQGAPAGQGYQGQNPRPSTPYQGTQPPRQGGFQNRPPYQGRPAGGAPGQRPSGPGGFRPQGQGGFRPQGAGGRPPFGQRPGAGQRPGSGAPGSQDMDTLNQRTPKKTFTKKKDQASYKKRNAEEEKEFQIQRRKEQAAAKLASVPKVVDMMEVITSAILLKR